MKINTGIVTASLTESKTFYTAKLDCQVIFETEWYLLLRWPGGEEIGFLQPGLEAQHPAFRKSYEGNGMWISIEVEDIDRYYKTLLEKDVEMMIPIRDEPWGERHFAFRDPNGVSIDVVKYKGAAD